MNRVNARRRRIESEVFWNVATTARFLGVAEQTLRKWVSERRIPSVKIGGRRRFEKAEIDLWIEKGRAPVVEGAAHKTPWSERTAQGDSNGT